METEEQQFIKGFNGGYIIAKHESELSTKILDKLEPSTDYTKGLISGKDEWQKEKELAQLQELNDLRNLSRELENNLDKDV